MFCRHCGKEIADGQAFCHACGGEVPLPLPQEKAQQSRTPWELRREVGFFRGIWVTLRESLFSPTMFFRNMPVSGGLVDPTLYAMITGMTGITLLVLWQVLFREALPMTVQEGKSSAGAMMFALFAPFLIIANLYLWAGMLHVLLILVRGVRHGFEATFRVAAHSYGALVFLAVPFCGWPLAAVWSMILAVIGLREAQGAAGVKAAFAVFFPILFCCAAMVFLSMLVFGTIASSFGALMPHPWK